MLFLPDYYGFELSSSLPLITASRMMFVVFYIYALINRRRDIRLKGFKIKELPKEYYFLFAYFILRLLSNLYYVGTYTEAVKSIFFIVFEQFMLLFAVYLLAPKREEIITLVKIIVYTAATLFVLGILESITGFNPFEALYTVKRDLYVVDYIRLGTVRTKSTMYAPSMYGNICILIMPLVLWLYEKTRSKIYLFIAGIEVLANIHSGCRSDLIFLVALLFFYFVYVLKKKERRLLFIKNASIITAVLILYMCLACAISPNLRYFYVGTAKSMLNEVGFDFDLTEDAPEGAGGYGYNPYGTTSRIRQFTGIYYTFQRNPVFGLGAAADRRRDVMFYWHSARGTDKWIHAYVYDVGVVEALCDEGIIGFLGVCSLFIYMLIKSKNNRFYKLTIFTYLLSTLSTMNMYIFLMMYIIISPSLKDYQNAQYIE